jgi:hypothetical protein
LSLNKLGDPSSYSVKTAGLLTLVNQDDDIYALEVLISSLSCRSCIFTTCYFICFHCQSHSDILS